MSAPANALHLVLTELRSHWRNFPVTHMLLFLEVARNDLEDRNLGILEIGESLDVPPATVSRGMVDLSPRTIPSGSSEAIDLVTTRPDKFDHRKRVPVLTKNGRRVYDKIIRILETAQPRAVFPPVEG